MTFKETMWLQRFQCVQRVPQGPRVHASMDEIWMKPHG